MKPRIIVCSLGLTGAKIFDLLQQQGAAVVGISNKITVEVADNVIIGELRAASTLLRAGIKDAQTLVLASNDDALNLAILTQAKILNPRIRIINRLFNSSLGDRLDQTLSDHVSLSVSALAAPVFAFAALGNAAIGQLRLFNQIWPIYEEVIDENHPWLGRPLNELWDDRSRMLIYYLPNSGEVDLVSAVVTGLQLEIGDRLIIGTQPNINNRRHSWLRKFKILTSLRQFQTHAQSVLIVACTLLFMIAAATLTYMCGNDKISLLDAFYFSIGIITGVGAEEKVVAQSPDSTKIFTAIMMLVGAGVIGIFYALLNDFVLGARFKQFLDAATVPVRQHHIVCGLGSIGIQIVNQLHCHGHEVVVIERDLNNRFLNIVHSLGIPVIHGDASLSETLTAANVQQSAALLAVTSDDTINLEIALSAKSLASKLPVVVRNQDPEFSRDVQQVFEFEAVLCPAEIATPAFAAAALGGRILGNGMTGDTLWVALATLITPGHPFCGRRVKEMAMAADFVPLYIETNCQTLHGWEVLETCLSSGDVLYLTMPACGLEQLWRVTPHQLIAS